MLLTGKHSGHAYVRDNRNPKGLDAIKAQYQWEFPGQYPLPPEETTLAEALHDQGYATGAMGKWGLGHFGTTGDPNRQGFDLFYGFNCQVHAHNHYPRFLWRNGTKETLPGNDRTLYGETFSQDRFIEEAIGFIDAHRQDPFFLFMPFTIPHLSIQVPEWAVGWYDQTIEEEAYEHKGYLPHPKPRAGYAAMVTYLDYGVGLIMNKLRSLGLEEETLVIFTSDNGSLFENLPLRSNKGYLYEGGIRVPWIMRWPGEIEAGKTSSLPVISSDLFPTLRDVAGWELSETDPLDGESLKGWILGEIPLKRNALYFHYPNYAFHKNNRLGSAIRKGHHKLIHFYDDDSLELYDLEKDLAESKDLSASSPELARALKLELDQWRQRTRAIAPTRVALP